MFLLRIAMPDRTGALGQVATAIGSVGVDIVSLEIVEQVNGKVIDDFLLELPYGRLPEELVGACLAIEGVQVLWLSRHHDVRGIESDLEIANQLGEDREHAAELLLEHLPRVFHSKWATLIDLQSMSPLLRSDSAPELNPDQIAALAPLDAVHFTEMSDAWLPGWGASSLAVVPDGRGRLLLVGRAGGPDFLESELFRLYHLARLAR